MKISHLKADHPEVLIHFQIENEKSDYFILCEILRHCIANCWCKGMAFDESEIKQHHEGIIKATKSSINDSFLISITDLDDNNIRLRIEVLKKELNAI